MRSLDSFGTNQATNLKHAQQQFFLQILSSEITTFFCIKSCKKWGKNHPDHPAEGV